MQHYQQFIQKTLNNFAFSSESLVIDSLENHLKNIS